MQLQTHNITTEQSFERDHQRYLSFYAAEAERVLAEWDLPIEHANLFAHAQAMNRDCEDVGYVRQETTQYAMLQNRRRTLESIGQPFAATIDVHFDGTDFRDQRGEAELSARMRGVLGAAALEMTNPEFGFYTRRTIYEFGIKMDEIEMMKHAPVGTVVGVVSPCHDVPHLAKQLGMLPSREMAVMQLSHKKSDSTMGITVFSLDGADEKMLIPFLAFYGVRIASDTKREDYLGKRFSGFAPTQEALQENYVKPGIAAYDALASERAGEPTRQGQTGAGIIDVEQRFERECGQATAAQLRMDEALSWVMGKPAELPPFLRKFSAGALKKVRSDGKPLLSTRERTLVQNLLNQEAVTVDDPTHAEALRIVKRVHETAVDDAVWRYFGGELSALHDLDDVDELIDSASEAAENGRYSEGCGSDSTFGQEGDDQACEINVAISPCCGRPTIFIINHGATTCMGCGSHKDSLTTFYALGRPRTGQEAAARATKNEALKPKKGETPVERREAAKLAQGTIQIVSGRAFRADHRMAVGGTRLVLVDIQTGAELAA